MSVRAFALALGAALAASSAALAGTGRLVGLPSPTQQLTPSPPLQTNAALFELRLPGRVRTRQRVVVGIDAAGKPVSLEAVQRLTMQGKGDYSFVVPAPVTDVVAAAGSDSEPGLRQDAIVWQGFSPGRRVLAARAKLRVRAASPSLPVRVSLRTSVGGIPLEPHERRSGALALELTIENVTAAKTVTFSATGVPHELVRFLDGLRRTVESGKLLGGYTATITTPARQVRTSVEAPLAVRGVLVFATGGVEGLSVAGGRARGASVSFTGILGDGRPLALHVRARGRASSIGSPRLSLVVEPVLPLRGLRPPRGRSWQEALRRGLVRPDGRALLTTAIDTLLRISRSRQYESFLFDPGNFPRSGADRTTYVYRTATARAAAPAPRSGGGGSGVVVPLVAAVAGVLAAGGLVVAWAHS